MKVITYHDFQPEIEKRLYKEIETSLNEFFGYIPSGKNDVYQDEKHYFELIKHAVSLKNHFTVKSVISKLVQIFDLQNTDIELFVYQDTVFNVTCFPRKTSDGKAFFQIFASQHFFNNLSEDEQIGIVGHEIAHFLFDHFKIPAHEIINHPFEHSEIGELKSNLIYHSKICEISADVIGLIANDFNSKAYSMALIKYITGLNGKNNVSPLIDIVLQQYHSYAEDVFFNHANATHPLVPVRVKIINEVAKLPLILNFGKAIPEKEYKRYVTEYNDLINDIVRKIYPEIFPDESIINEVLIPMSVAVMLADNKIDQGEVSLINNMIKKAHRDFDELKSILSSSEYSNFNRLKSSLIDQSIKTAKKENFDKNLIVPVIRKLIIVAASDGNIETSELNTIFKFAKEFNISKKDIVMMIKTQYKI